MNFHFQSCQIPKERVTCMACFNVSGTIKIPITIVTKSTVTGEFDQVNVKNLQQLNGWMDRKTFNQWLVEVFEPTVNGIYKEEKILLLVDNSAVHFGKKTSKKLLLCTNFTNIFPETDYKNISVVFFPATGSNLIKPCNKSTISTIKQYYRSSMLQRFNDIRGKSLKDFKSSLDLCQAGIDLSLAWNSIEESTLRNSWAKLLQKEKEVQSAEEVNLFELIRKIPVFQDLTEEDTKNWLNCDKFDKGYQIFDEDEIVNLLLSNIDPLNLPEDFNYSSHFSDEKEDVLKAADTLLRWIAHKNTNKHDNLKMELQKVKTELLN